ncbi:hypothetical protein YTPLAS21_16980 [Candidatus Nitrosocosmicus sp.]|nr:hypothetical protein YTPLAS21_16980 [Candidatus Nitrosocosmicus sp.]
MTLPKGYVIPNKEAEDKAKREAEDNAKREAEDKASSKTNDPALVKPEGTPALVKPEGTPMNSTTTNSDNVVDYYALWDQLRDAYLQTMKEAISSYFRLLDFWSQYNSQK